MNGLITTSLQRFLEDTYGREAWLGIAERAKVPDAQFETMLSYPEDLFDETLAAASAELKKSPTTILEDMGTHIISHPDLPALRRLLRFCGASFSDFLNGLEDLRDRASLAVPGLDIPALELKPLGGKRYHIRYNWHRPDGIHVIAGILRAMADDYGTLAFMEVVSDDDGQPVIEISVLDRVFTSGREFELGAQA
ncbi:MAG: heme NO-binding domain-containing protein [Dinoroseobacter sp.]|nr:heme NO-binding domain-containing protein [Dinoroseobacter sp.]